MIWAVPSLKSRGSLNFLAQENVFPHRSGKGTSGPADRFPCQCVTMYREGPLTVLVGCPPRKADRRTKPVGGGVRPSSFTKARPLGNKSGARRWNRSLGKSLDIQFQAVWPRYMVTGHWGMSDRLGPMSFRIGEETRFLGQGKFRSPRDFSRRHGPDSSMRRYSACLRESRSAGFRDSRTSSPRPRTAGRSAAAARRDDPPKESINS